MKTRNKALLMMLCAVMLVAASVFGTIAYFTDSESVANTFTVGKVGLKLDEAKVDVAGNPVDKEGNVVTELSNAERTEEGNEYHLIPGHTYVKDPTVTVDAGSEAAYVRMIVTVENIDQLMKALPQSETIIGDDGTTSQVVIEDNLKYYNGDVFLLQMLCLDDEGNNTWDNTDWPYYADGYSLSDDGKTAVYEFRYKEIVSRAEAAAKLDPLFTHITLPGEVDNEGIIGLEDVTITVKAHAIQADGFDTADDAWEKFN